MSGPALAIGLLLLAPAGSPPAPARAPVASFQELLAAEVRAEATGDAAAAERALREIRRARIERNVTSLDTVGLALVRRGVERLDRGERDSAEDAFRAAVALAPGLPDAHFGLATTLLRKGPLGALPSAKATVTGVLAFLDTARGEVKARDLLAVAWLVCVFALICTVAVALLLRRGGLLKHDIEERLGSRRRGMAGVAALLLLLLAPVVAMQGWGWLPLWWLALLYAYLGRAERVTVVGVLLALLTVGPAITSLDYRARTVQNPLFAASMAAVEGAPEPSDLELLEQAANSDPQDRDLASLLGNGHRRAGRYDQAAQLYGRLLAADPGDTYSANNLANLDFSRGAYDAALARYKAGTEARDPGVAATSYYNLSLAYLSKFDYQAYNEAKSNADRLARRLVAQYDRWKYDSGDYAVVDLGLSRDQVWDKLGGTSSGVAVRNVLGGAPALPQAGSLLASAANRLAGALAAFLVVVLVLRRWRGPKAATVHCARCGAAFCHYCQLAQTTGGLCSQCFHLFVVRDGVSGPARNRKMTEVQRAETRRRWVFRVLSVLAPGAGHLYAGRTVVGLLLLVPWYAALSLIVACQLTPFTEVSSRLLPPWPLLIAGVVLAAIWVSAHRVRADVSASLVTAYRPGARRARATQGV
ncbi:MAG TPA: tetratricopeptide repeat protein [Vicinamibacteria bacterium]|nr:tetratricopeptide repeat protein [Vicinamibacteria bacterium]